FFSSRRRHTRCLSDWSSDVCSSDLSIRQAGHREKNHRRQITRKEFVPQSITAIRKEIGILKQWKPTQLKKHPRFVEFGLATLREGSLYPPNPTCLCLKNSPPTL